MKENNKKTLVAVWLLLSLSILALAVALASNSSVVAASPTSGTNCATPEVTNYWCTSTSPNDSGSNVLSSISVVNYNDIWAAGESAADEGIGGVPLIEHWGSSHTWSIVTPLPTSVDPGYTALNGVAAYIPSTPSPGPATPTASPVPAEVWAVGAFTDATCNPCTIVEHGKNGTWSLDSIPTPVPTTLTSNLNGVTVGDPLSQGPGGTDYRSAFTVGTYQDSGGPHTLVYYWDGTHWNVQNSPDGNNHSYYSNLAGVAESSNGDVWAVGYTGDTSNNRRPLILHRDSSGWSDQTSTIIPTLTTDSFLDSVDVFNPTDAWAVGSYKDPNSSTYFSLILHWNGTKWAQATNIPSPGVSYNELHSVYVNREGDVWTVGEYSDVCRSSAAPNRPDCIGPTPTPTASPAWGVWGVSPYYSSASPTVAPDTIIPNGGTNQLILHWHGGNWDEIDGAHWNQVTAPNASWGASQLLGVAAGPPSLPITDVWAVGNYVELPNDHSSTSRDAQTLIQNYTAPPPPNFSHSYYESNTSYAAHYYQGCLAAANGETGVIVLDYGEPKNWATPTPGVTPIPTYGTWLVPNLKRADMAGIATAVVGFADGYHASYYPPLTPGPGTCPRAVGTPGPAGITIGVGTSNSNYDRAAELTAGHGTAWAQLVNSFAQYLIDHNYSEIRAAGASDLEPGFSVPPGSTPTPGYDYDYPKVATWTAAYNSVATPSYYNYGSTDGHPCPPTGSCSGFSTQNSGWNTEQLYNISWGLSKALPLPEIYQETWARDWYVVERYSQDQHSSSMVFSGAMAQCSNSATICPKEDIPYQAKPQQNPEQAWQVLWLVLQADPVVPQYHQHLGPTSSTNINYPPTPTATP